MVVGMLALLKNLALALHLHAAVPTLAWSNAYKQAAAASLAATPHVRPELLLAIAFVESRYDPTALSRVEGSRRRTGNYHSRRPPRHLDRHASMFCGPLQTQARSWRACLHQRKLSVAYTKGARELESWLRDRRVHGNVARALAGYGCGNHGVRTGHCNFYPQRVLWVERRIVHGKRAKPHHHHRHHHHHRQLLADS